MDFTRDIEDYDLVFLDLETTGLFAAAGDAICEVGAIKIKNRRVVDKFHTMVDPQRDIPDQAAQIHGISAKDVENAPVFKQIAQALLKFLDESVLCAYNVSFDAGFINEELKRIDFPELQVPAVDVLGIARNLLKLSRNNLSEVAQFFRIESKSPMHRALEDADIASQVFFKLRDMLKEKEIAHLNDYLSLYGWRNKVFQVHQEAKTKLIGEAISRGSNVRIRYFSYESQIREVMIKPLGLFNENGREYLWCRKGEEVNFRIRLNRVLRLEKI